MSAIATWVGSESLHADAETNCRYWSRGYAIDDNGTVLVGKSIGSYLAGLRDKLGTAVPRLNGCFAAYLENEEYAVIISDRFGTLPIYHGADRDAGLAVGDNPWSVIGRSPEAPRLDDAALIDFLHCGYVTSTNTLIKGVETTAPATITRIFPGRIRTERYWTYGYAPEAMDMSEAVDELAVVLEAVVRRSCSVLTETAGTPVLTLSGGLDSRLLAALFSSAEAFRTSAVSYGSANDPEVAVAIEIARALHIDHRCVPVGKGYFNSEFLERSIQEVGITTRFTCGTGARHIQCRSGDVLVPGHTGDFVSGGHLPPQAALVENRNQLQRFVDLRHFRYPYSDKILREVMQVDPRKRFDRIAVTTSDFDMAEDKFGLIDRWNVENRQRRLILMELRAYEAAAPWILPFYDHELVDFFARIPHSLRVGQFLYVTVALTKIFTGQLAQLGSIRRVGGALLADSSAYRKSQRFAGFPAIVRTPLLAAWPLARRMGGRFGNRSPARSGPDPIRHWFREEPDVRDFLSERLRAVTLAGINSRRILELAQQDWVPEQFFHRLVTSTITAQETLTKAGSRWRTDVEAVRHSSR